MKKALFICDYGGAPYHGGEVSDALASAALAGEFEVTPTGEWSTLTAADLAAYDLVIDYASCTRKELNTKAFIAALVAYVAGGGRLLSVHSGIILSAQTSYELLHLMGANFLGHPARARLKYTAVPGKESHPAIAGATDFELFEEPYRFDMDKFTDFEMLLTFEYEGVQHPAAWTHAYGLGRVVYIQPGHDSDVFAEPAFAALLRSAARYCAE